MHCSFVIILLAFGASIAAQEHERNDLSDELAKRVLKSLPSNPRELEGTVLGKPGHVAMSAGNRYYLGIPSVARSFPLSHRAHHRWQAYRDVDKVHAIRSTNTVDREEQPFFNSWAKIHQQVISAGAKLNPLEAGPVPSRP
eukprot:gnl/TRDRNA2_/TRDRNA2_151693_c2_seq1.p1 gnl/TRDRNA2_/TRDRNA2_151693_c2~~gnl/TRDRNA2_/TRDRNA2_151693_c2_seq1.p1  ORF type:complete len:141 (+),score=23.00 gnl/TRDRNA2_/TRDRNA2_151693_c2_seq1:105-527(+)